MNPFYKKKFVFVLIERFDEKDYWFSMRKLERYGRELEMIGDFCGKTYLAKGGMQAVATKAYSDVDAAMFSGLLIPGFNTDLSRRSKECLDLIREFYERGKLVAFIFRSGWMPISCGIFPDKRRFTPVAAQNAGGLPLVSEK